MARSIGQAVLRKAFGLYPATPWIPFAAIRALESLIEPDWVAWEIGAGMSTIWLSQRVHRLTSIEHNEVWYLRVTDALRKQGIENVDLRLRKTGDQMADMSDLPRCSLDLLFIDGGPRSECLFQGFDKVKSGGVIYMDNWDVEKFWEGSEEFLCLREAQVKQTIILIDYLPASVKPSECCIIIKGDK